MAYKPHSPLIVYCGAQNLRSVCHAKGMGEGADMYFNYHTKAKALINGGHLTSYEIVDDWNGIKPALVLHFDNNRSMPIREHKWDEYLLMINGR